MVTANVDLLLEFELYELEELQHALQGKRILYGIIDKRKRIYFIAFVCLDLLLELVPKTA